MKINRKKLLVSVALLTLLLLVISGCSRKVIDTSVDEVKVMEDDMKESDEIPMDDMQSEGLINPNDYVKPSDSEIKEMLSDLEYD